MQPRCWNHLLRPQPRRRFTLALLLLAGLKVGRDRQGFSGLSWNTARRSSQLVVKAAEDPDLPQDKLIEGIKGTFKISQETQVEDVEFTTPWDGLFGSGGRESAETNEDDGFVDSSDEANYITLTIERPFGMGLGQATEDGGAKITEVRPNSNAAASGGVQAGYQLIVIGDKPVYGMPLDDIFNLIEQQDGPVRITLFKGDAQYFYGKFGPSSAWLSEFINNLVEY